MEENISFKEFVEEKRAAEEPQEAPSLKEFVETKRQKTAFKDFVTERREKVFIPYLNEAENAEVEMWTKTFEEDYGGDIERAISEGFFGRVMGAAAGFVVGPTIGRIIANALGVERGVLYDMFTSRVVSAALGVAISKSLGGEYKPSM